MVNSTQKNAITSATMLKVLKKRIKYWGICDKTFLYPAKVGNNQYGQSNVICEEKRKGGNNNG